MADHCQKCQAEIPSGHGRWMFVPEGAPQGFHLDKCQGCGAWTSTEEKIVQARFNQISAQLRGQRAPGGCNCTGTR